MSCTCNFGAGFSTCHCAQCHRTFTSITAFDMHQGLDDGRTVCTDPAFLRRRDGQPQLAALRMTPDGQEVWGQYDARQHPHDAPAPPLGEESQPLSGPEGTSVGPRVLEPA